MATNLNLDDDKMRDVLRDAKTVAVVGHSDKSHRTSYQIAQGLRRKGYTVYAVNPTVTSIDGEPSYASLNDIPEPVDIVNVFRRSEYVATIVDEAIETGAKVIFTQLGVVDKNAQSKALAAGLDVAMDRCIKVEIARLGV